MTGLEIVGLAGGGASLALAGAVIWLVIAGQRNTAKLEGALILASTERMDAERRASTEATRSATLRMEAGQLRVALAQATEELAREREVPKQLRAAFKEVLRDLEACSSPVAVRDQLRRMLSDDRDPS